MAGLRTLGLEEGSARFLDLYERIFKPVYTKIGYKDARSFEKDMYARFTSGEVPWEWAMRGDPNPIAAMLYKQAPAVEYDARAAKFIKQASGRKVLRIIANRPDSGLPDEYEHKLREARDSHHLAPNERVLFIEVRPGDVSEFSDILEVRGVDVGGHHVLRCVSPAIPNAIAVMTIAAQSGANDAKYHTR